MKFIACSAWVLLAIATPVMGEGVKADPLDRPIRQGTPSAVPVTVRQVGQNLYMITGRGGNVVAKTTPDGLILVDNKVMYRAVYQELKRTLAALPSGGAVKYAFVTHHHADHGGNSQALIDDGAVLIGHESLAGILATYRSSIAPVNPAAPTVTFDHIYKLELGGVQVVAYHWGPGHTRADIAVHFPRERVVAVGDMVYQSGELAVDALDGGGSLIGMRRRIDDLLALDFDVVVPGHGDNVMTRGELELYAARLGTLIGRGVEAVKAGVAADALVEAMRSDDLGFRLVGHFWSDPKYLAPIYAELQGVAAGSR